MNIYVDVPYKEKDEAKNLGAKWDSSKKKWFFVYETIFQDNLYLKIRKWNPIFEKSKFMPYHYIIASNGLDINLAKKTIRNLKWFEKGEITMKFLTDKMSVYCNQNDKLDYVFTKESEEIFLNEYNLLLKEKIS